MKKLGRLFLSTVLCFGAFGCSNKGSESTPISVISREEGSGTRGAFIELFGIEQKDADGKKVDCTAETAEITNSTSVMITTVEGNQNAIGYISLGSLNDQVKALRIDGIEPTAENVKNGTYKIARPFNLAFNEATLNETAKDFIAFIMSEEGQSVVESAGCVSQGNTGPYIKSDVNGKIKIEGSSSVYPVMEKLQEAYAQLQPNVVIEVQQDDSTTGISAANEGLVDIGMASRALKESELADGLTSKVMAMDGIAVIVNKNNPLENCTSETVASIFMGETTAFDEVK